MPSMILNCQTLGALDGGIVGELIDRELLKAVTDFEDRGEEDGKPREIVIKVTIERLREMPVVSVQVQAKLPPARSHVTKVDLKANRQGNEIWFQSNNPDNPHQPTLSDFDVASGEVPNEIEGVE